MITRSEARAMPEFGAAGRTAFYGDTWFETLLNDRAGIGADRLYGFITIILVMYLLRRPARLVIPGLVKDMVWTSVLLFALAHLLLFKLHVPSRYVLYTLPLAALLVIAANGEGTLTALGTRWPVLRQGVRWLVGHRHLGWLGLGVLALAFVYVQNRYVVGLDPLTVRVDRTALQLYAYLQTLPKDIVIAGHPLEMDNVPLFARRKVLVNQELSLPYFTGYYAEVRQRLHDSLLAYYAADAQQVQRFVEHYGVDYILLNTAHFEPAFLRGRVYYEPFGSLLKQRLATQRRFALLEAPPGERVYVHGPYILVSFVHRQKGPDGRAQDRGEHRHPRL
jgi:hypothetical protein